MSTQNEELLQQRNAQLEQQLSEKITELQEKKRTLQIEAALERVRSRTMAMHQSEEIADIVSKIFGELRLLDFILNRVLIWIFNDEEKYITWWSANPEVDGIVDSYRVDYNDQPVFLSYLQAWQKRTPLHLYALSGEAKKKWEDHLFSNTGMAKLPVAVREGMRAEGTIFTASTISDYGLMMVGSFEPLSDENINIIQRFGRVFQQSYTRYLDVRKAETQARESQIQLALERVRARTMAMHRSEELAETAHVLFHQLQELGGIPDRIAIGIVDEPACVVNFWSTDQSGSHIGKSFQARLNEEKVMAKTYEAWKNSKKSLIVDLHGEDVKEWIRFAREEMGVTVKDEFIKDHRVHNFGFFSHGWILVTTHELQSAETILILERFAAVFSLTYRRFLDLQKAEAQARESQIQLALERVRARTMAMQKSEELPEVSSELYHQLKELGEPADQLTIGVVKEEENIMEMSATLLGKILQQQYRHSIDEPIVMQKLFSAWKAGQRSLIIDIGGRELEQYNQFRNELTASTMFPVHITDERRILYIAFYSKGTLALATSQPRPEGSLQLLERFAKVFEQTYTRFLDLQKAEAQAREAQIEAGLERMRARTMGMQKSHELREVTIVLYDQLKNLGFNHGTAAIIIMDASTGDIDWWMEGLRDGYRFLESCHVKYFNHKSHNEQLEHWKNGDPYAVIKISGDKKKAFDKVYFNETDFIRVPEETKALMMRQETVIFSMAYMQYGALSWAPVPIGDEQAKILQRFAKVFEQCYTRFLDLQKAESQAREAEIELALERVRAKTMAMKKQDDLIDVINLLAEQLIQLGFDLQMVNFSNGFNERDWDLWIFAVFGEGVRVSNRVLFPWFDHPFFQRVKNALDRYHADGSDFSIEVFTKQEKDRWLDYCFTETSFRELPPESQLSLYNTPGYCWSGVILKDTWIVIGKYDTQPFTVEQNSILRKFANAFGQAYTRFLDLQKAEAQAREAEIELGLERVRARAMAMQNSDELNELIATVFTELTKLDLVLTRCVIQIYEGIEKGVRWWMANPEAPSAPTNFFVRYADMPFFNEYLKAWNERSLKWQYVLEGENKIKTDAFLFNETELSQLPDFVIEGMKAADRIYLNASFNNFGNVTLASLEPLSEEHFNILLRFAKVFDLTYTRFNDIKQAEAQAKEAQIEAALERVRARTMAMQKSDELPDTSYLVFQQFENLGTRAEHFSIGIINEAEEVGEMYATIQGDKLLQQRKISIHEPIAFNKAYTAWKSKKKNLALEITGDELKTYNIYRNNIIGRKLFSENPNAGDRWIILCAFFSTGLLSFASSEPAPEEILPLLERFAKVFEQTYTRFLDLQRAEAQARESQIEAALERVRSKTMAMHNSNDVGETVAAMFAEFIHLGIHTNRCGILIFDDADTAEVWTARSTPEGSAKLIIGKLDLDAHKMLRSVYYAWIAKELFYQYDLLDDDLKNYYTAINNSKFYPTQFDLHALPAKEFHSDFFFKDGALFSFTNEPVAEEEAKIMKRFAGVFGQTYRRYLDLQKAEAQAKEAKIEASLERVRSKAMAMHNSQDLADTIGVFYRELKSFSITPRRCGVGLLDNEDRVGELFTWNTTEHGDSLEVVGRIKLENHPVLEGVYDHWVKQTEYHPVLRGNEIKEYYKIIRPQIAFPDYTHDQMLCGYFFFFKEGGVYAWTENEMKEDELNIYRRFTTVLSLTYKRYRDLQKAEAQAREAQIEAGLERVRARTMAMHSSDDVSAATATMFTELERLGIENFRGGINNILPNRTQEVWSVNNLAEGKVVKAVGVFDIDAHPFWQLMFKEWEAKKDFLHYFLAGEEKEEYIKILNAARGYLTKAIENFPDVHFQVYYFNEGSVFTNSLQPHSEGDKQIMKRFASVFSLTFRRYQDLQKAEAQAREATIEAALEKVRGKAMAMHDSNDLSATASMVFAELRKLGINPIRCGVGLLNKESRKAQLYSAGDSLSLVGWVILSEHPVLEKIYESWQSNEEYYPELHGEQMRLYYQLLLKGLPVVTPDTEDDKKQYGHFLPFSIGCLYAWSDTAYNETEIKILRRFATIIDLTFRRYMELQRSEANSREAVKQAALDRIRADIASMRTVADLDRITPLIWNELTILGLPFVRCGVFIMDGAQQLIHTFLSTPDGKAIAAFHMPYDTPGNFAVMVNHWEGKKMYVSRWTEDDFVDIAEILLKQGEIATKDQYLNSLPKGGFYLHFLPFLQGMLYVGNTERLTEEQIELIQHVADAFSTAYARYEDFNKLEAAKQQVERTLVDLKQAQQQLIQSEKMASLGELTAGIAHEIQNPLNFVNNFSEVSGELIDELQSERSRVRSERDDALESEIINDIKVNLEKINHHGKRADAIVKGMLQHSRKSEGVKEATDINALCDEYLRLSYHGLRAKDKSFNATIKTEFDNSIGKINVVPQEIGRVLLNLLNNAFYAVNERYKAEGSMLNVECNQCVPTITVVTKKLRDTVEIIISDNGPGIPQNIINKIFQPFFTTKPTGQGTGLGLSLAYDIIKTHGGEIKIKTKEGEGSEFIIQLPIS